MADRDELDWIKEHEPWRLGKEVKEEVPDESWTETKIEDWIEKKGLPIDYDIRRRTKKWALDKINSIK